MSFDKAFARTAQFEGGYANNPNDLGGETYAGIARNHHLSWAGWVIIDHIKARVKTTSRAELNKELLDSDNLKSAVREFYRNHFWTAPKLNLVDEVSPDVAEKLYDIAVNMGPARAGRFLQEGLNLLNVNGKRYPTLTVDGKIGPATCKALTTCLKSSPTHRLLTVIAILQGSHYVKRMQEKPSQRVFIGWYDRVFDWTRQEVI